MNPQTTHTHARKYRDAGHDGRGGAAIAAAPPVAACAFKICPLCGARWRTRRAFEQDPMNSLNGVQAALGGGVSADFAVYTHLKSGCGTSMLIPLGDAAPIDHCPVVRGGVRAGRVGLCGTRPGDGMAVGRRERPRVHGNARQ
jgi:hypothetical protein